MSEGQGEPNQNRKESVANANIPSDSPVTDPGHVRTGNSDGTAGKFEGQRGKSGALKKSARYRSRSLSASSADSYSSTSYTGITDSPLFRACMEEEDAASHIIQHCPAVSDYRAKYLGPPGSLPETTGNIKGLLRFFGKLGWLE